MKVMEKRLSSELGTLKEENKGELNFTPMTSILSSSEFKKQ